jgi:hypothetical protein
MKLKFLSIALIVFFVATTSCKKTIDAIKEQVVVDAITDGIWTVTRFTEAGTNKTTDYTGWEFQYFNNGTSVAKKTGQPDVPGTWSGNAADWTFTATFTVTPPVPLDKLAGVWTVTRAVATNKGSYSRTIGGVVYELELTKK